MCKKSLLLFILVLLSNLAYGEGQNSNITKINPHSLVVAKQNNEIDEKKYAHPNDFLYEEIVEDIPPEYAEENKKDQERQQAEVEYYQLHDPSVNEPL